MTPRSVLVGSLSAALLQSLMFGVPASGQDASDPADAPDAPERREVHPDRLQPIGVALHHSQGVRKHETKVLTRLDPAGPERIATVDFDGRIVLFAADGGSFQRIKLEGASAKGNLVEDLHCVQLRGKPHWLAVINRLRDKRITIGLYTLDGARVASHVPQTERGQHVTVNVEFADVSGDEQPEIVGTITRSTRETDTETGEYLSELFVLNDKCEVLAQRAIDAQFPGMLHVCPPAKAGEPPLILLEESSSIRKFTFRDIRAESAPTPEADKPSP